MTKVNGAPGEIRTPGLLLRRQPLYPAELRAHSDGTQIGYHFRLPTRSRTGLFGRQFERMEWHVLQFQEQGPSALLAS